MVVVGISSLPQYPLAPTPEDVKWDVDWGFLFFRVVIHGIIILFIGLMLAALAIAVTYGQILGLLDVFK
jgi:hypothetical protein